jgi:DNA-binding NarL/FixJ family response regulator
VGSRGGSHVMKHVLIVDNHGVYRKGLRTALESVLPDTRILEADNLEIALRELDPDGSLDLVLVDVDAAGTVLDTLCRLRRAYPKTRIVAVSATFNRKSVLQSLDSGLNGFIAKSQPDEEIFSAINDVLSGRIYVPLMLSQVDTTGLYPDMILNHHAARAPIAPSIPSEGEREAPKKQKLTPRQREILDLLAKGMSNKEIARVLKIREGTTKIHTSGVLRVLGVRNRTEAAAAARDYLLQDQRLTHEKAKLDQRPL